MIRELVKYIHDVGEGQFFLATAGMKNVDGISEALEKAVEFVN